MSNGKAEWLSFPDAFALIAAAYRQRQPEKVEKAEQWAINAVVDGLARGTCRARAVHAWLDQGALHAFLVIAFSRGARIPTALDIDNYVNPAFWQCLKDNGAVDAQDWENGNIAFSGTDPVFKHTVSGQAEGVEIERHNLPLVGHGSAYARSDDVGKVEPAEKSKRNSNPRLSESDLQRWWNKLKPEEQNRPQSKLLAFCREQHPGKLITRQRIRDLTRGRKRGPRPITPN